ncbi:MAG: TIM barrel protein [Planctomycetaceae bacterium]|nr:TIM barrel protein [Planctomycetaceae bacterium]
MQQTWTRRNFLTTAAAAGAGLLAARQLGAAPTSFRRKKSLIGVPSRETFEQHQAAGFDGLESTVWECTPEAAAKDQQLAAEFGMRIHSVLRGWTDFNSPTADKVTQDIDSVKTALRACQGYGADALLLVPCRLLAQVALPKPEEFDIEFDDRTGHLTRVVAGDNEPYTGYLQAHNEAIDMARQALEQLIPTAEQTGVVIALENVWSNLWVLPALFAHFVRSFQTPWIQSYFDIGNHVKYASPEAWIEALGKTIVKLHVKDFKVDRAAPGGGEFVDIRDGDVNWPSVMRALDQIGYDGWLTIEGSGGLSLAEQSRRLDLILAGE